MGDMSEGPVSLQSWQLHSVLDVERIMATGINVAGLGSFILGGFKQLSSSFLPLGATGDFEKWDSLYTERWGHACARIGDTVVVAGGVSPFFTIMDSTTLLDLSTREQRDGGAMSSPRTWFGMARVNGKVLAFGGTAGVDPLDSIEEWDSGSESWLPLENEKMATAMHGFASMHVKQDDFCGSK